MLFTKFQHQFKLYSSLLLSMVSATERNKHTVYQVLTPY